MATTTQSLLRLLQIADSSFPVGGFAFSHGLEWLKQTRAVTDEAGVADFLRTYVDQVVGRQALPAALAAARATGIEALLRGDERLDASVSTQVEREAGRAMGERLLVGASGAFAGGWRVEALLAAVRAHRTPGQHAVAFGAIAADEGVDAATMLTVLGFGMTQAVTQAAIRLGVIGQAAAGRLLAGAAGDLDIAVQRATDGRPRFGVFAPNLDAAGLLHGQLPFRMFAS